MKEEVMMPVEKFEAVLDAGAELFDSLRNILRSYGLDTDDAPAVLTVASAGVFSVSPVDFGSFGEMIDVTKAMWRRESSGNTLDSLEFDPPHRDQRTPEAVAAGN